MPTEGVVIREVRREDRQALASIIERTGNLSVEEKDCAVELLDIYLNDSAQKDYYFITALCGGVPAGYACYGPRPLAAGVHDLYWIVVDQDNMGRGIGKALVERVRGLLTSQGARMLVAETSGLADYAGTREFYLRCGFAEEARIREFYKPGDDIVFYVMRLTHHAK